VKKLIVATQFVSALALAAAIAAPVHAANVGDAIALGADAQVVWFQNTSFAYDTELGGKGAFSITPHIAAVASAHYGLGQSYGRADAGARFTVTDVADNKSSLGVGFEREWFSKDTIGPSQWVADVSYGQKVLPWCILGAQGAYLLTTKTARASLGITVPFKLVKGAQ
jgi:hypothetical protein